MTVETKMTLRPENGDQAVLSINNADKKSTRGDVWNEKNIYH